MEKVVSSFGFSNGNKLFNIKSEDICIYICKWSKDIAMKYSEDLNEFALYSARVF
jgi:hypothetical protein